MRRGDVEGPPLLRREQELSRCGRDLARHERRSRDRLLAPLGLARGVARTSGAIWATPGASCYSELAECGCEQHMA